MSYLDYEKSIVIKQHSEIMKAVYNRINNYHKRPLHPGQIRVAKAILTENKRIVQAQYGRSAGKSETLLFIAWVYALLNPNSLVYIICPERVHADKIYWTPRRLQDYGPPEYILQERDAKMILEFKNGSKICLDGCENYNSLRGIKPHLVIYDEFQKHSKEFDLEVMRPNLTAKRSALLAVGTPPRRSCYYVDFRKNLLESIEAGDTSRCYFEGPSEQNPSLDKDELRKTKEELIKNKDENIWFREYEGKLILGGEGAVFPMWFDQKVKIIRPHDVIMSHIARQADKLNWYTICDPGTTKCFAVLFAIHNPYTCELFLLDEIYEKQTRNTSAIKMWLKIKDKQHELAPNVPDKKWKVIYDEAAAWFANEVQQTFRENMRPTSKASRNIEDDISMIKEIINNDKVTISDRCKWLAWEMDNFITDEDGDFPKDSDHLVDDFRYFVAGCKYKFIEAVELEAERARNRQSHNGDLTVESVSSNNSDWSNNVLSDSYEGYDDYFDA